jgi:hypothetical protein
VTTDEASPLSIVLPHEGCSQRLMVAFLCSIEDYVPLSFLSSAGREVGVVVCVRAKDMKEAWCLATSHAEASAREIINYYAKRPTSEPGLRDTKDPRFGMGDLAILRGDMDIAAEPDDMVKAQLAEKGEQLDVAEAAIGLDRDGHALGQRLGEAEQTEVFIVVALVFQLALEHRQPQQRRRSTEVRDEVGSFDRPRRSRSTPWRRRSSGAGRPSRPPRGRTCPIRRFPDC